MSIAIVSWQRAGQLQREPAVVAEAVEQPSARVARGRLAILALIEKQPGLLSAPQVDVVLDAAFDHADRFGHVAGQHVHALLQPFEQARARVVAREDPARRQQIA